MQDEKDLCRKTARWAVRLAAACILLYLGVRHIGAVARAAAWLAGLTAPLWLGLLLALMLNVPMRFIERGLARLLPRRARLRRGAAAALAFLFVAGLFAGAAFLVLPELADAAQRTAQALLDGLDRLAALDGAALARLPFGDALLRAGVDWQSLRLRLEQWAHARSLAWMGRVMEAAGAFAGRLVDLSVGLVFAFYFLANKEQLRAQVRRLVQVWLPRRFGAGLLHAADVCSATFGRFIAGQALEASILGTLCAAGMLLLRLPYAPMLGALVGVTALIPVVGGFVGLGAGVILLLPGGWGQALAFAVFLLVLQQLEGNLIYPRVVGSRLHLPAVWVLAAVTVGGKLAGPFGMFLGVPAASSAYALLRECTDARAKKQTAEASAVPLPPEQG